MKRILAAMTALTILLAITSIGAVFPAGTAGDSDLIVASNSATTTLNGAINASVTTFVLTSGTRFVNNMAVTIDGEIIFCTTLTTNTFSGCTRGYNGTTAATHSNGATVSGFLIAAHHNALADEIKAIEGALRGTAPSGFLTISLKAGAAQSTNPLVAYLNNAGTVLSQVDSAGGFVTYVVGVQKVTQFQNLIQLSSDSLIQFKDNVAVGSGSVDIGLGRNAAGILEVNNGVLGTLRDLKLRSILPTGGTIQDASGATILDIRPGAGQSTSAYLRLFQDAAGTVVSSQFDGVGSYNNFGLSPNVKKISIYNGAALFTSDAGVAWKDQTNMDTAGSFDAGLSRNAAGVVEVNNGTAGTYRDFKLRTLKRSVLTVATLPGAPADGDMVAISDSADGSCATGSGSIRVTCIYNGTSWIAH